MKKKLIPHDNDTTVENQQPVKKKQLTDNRSNKSGLSKRDNWKRSVDNGIATVNSENSTTTESVELQNISNIRNNLERNNVNKDKIVKLGDSTMKDVDGWTLSRLLNSKSMRVKVMHFSGATTAYLENYIKSTFKQIKLSCVLALTI